MSAPPTTNIEPESGPVERSGATAARSPSQTPNRLLADAIVPVPNSEATGNAQAGQPSTPTPNTQGTEQIERVFALMRAHFQGGFEDDTAALACVANVLRERDELRIERDALQDLCRLLHEEVALMRNIVNDKVAHMESWVNAMDVRCTALENARADTIANSQP